MAQLIEIDTGRVVEIEENRIEEAVGTGRYKFQTGFKIPVSSPDGQVGTIDGAEAMNAFASGFRYMTPQEVNRIKLQEEFGGTGGELLAGAAGAARGATLGLSDVALTKSGLVEQETLRNLREANPTASTVGEVGGAVGSAILPGALVARGAGAAAKAAGVLPGALAAKAGTQAAAGVGAKVAGKGVLARSLPVGVGSAIEGSAFGIGQAITEDALGTADLNAERLIAGAAFGAGTGFAFGAPIGFIGALINKPTQKLISDVDHADLLISQDERALATNALAKVFKGEALEKGEEAAYNKVFGSFDDINEALKRKDSIVSKAYDKTVDGVSVITGADADSLKEFGKFNRAGRELRKAATMSGAEKRRIQQEVADLLNKEFRFRRKSNELLAGKIKKKTMKPLLEEVNPNQAFDEAVKVYSKMRERLDEIFADPEYYTGTRFVKDFDRGLKELERKLTDVKKTEDIFDLMNEAKRRNFDEAISPIFDEAEMEKLSIGDRDTLRELKKLADSVRGHLEDTNAYGAAGEVQKRINRVITENTTRIGAIRKVLVGKEPGTNRLVVDLGKVEGWMNRMGRTNLVRSGAKTDEAVQDFINQGQDVRKTLAELGGDSAQPLDDALLEDSIEKFITEGARRTKAWENLINTGGSLSNAKDDVMRIFQGDEALKGAQSSDKMQTAIREIADDAVSKIMRSSEDVNKKILDLVERFNTPKRFEEMVGDGFVSNTPAMGLRTLQKIEDIFSALKSRQKSAVKGFLKKTDKLKRTTDSIRRAGVTGTVQQSLQEKRERRKQFSKDVQRLGQLTSNPSLLQEIVAAQMEPVFDAAPNTAVSTQSLIVRSLQFLNQKTPTDPLQGMRPMELFDVSPSISDSEISRWYRYVRAVNDPLMILDELREGRPTRESVETVQTLYPNLYEGIREEIMNQIVDQQFELTYGQRLSLSRLFGVPLDPSSNPIIAVAIQQTLSQGQQQQGASQNIPKNQIRGLNEQLQTNIERVQS